MQECQEPNIIADGFFVSQNLFPTSDAVFPSPRVSITTSQSLRKAGRSGMRARMRRIKQNLEEDSAREEAVEKPVEAARKRKVEEEKRVRSRKQTKVVTPAIAVQEFSLSRLSSMEISRDVRIR